MENKDSIRLLKECDAGTKMGISSIEDVLDRVKDQKLRDTLSESRSHHKKLEDDLQTLLNAYDSEEKEPNMMAKGMSWLKTNMKMTMDNSDATIADLMTDGCNMGIKSLQKYLNQYPCANEKVKELCFRLIDIEEQLRDSMKNHL